MRISLKANIWTFIAAANGFIAVAASALGAHMLKSTLSPEQLSWFSDAAEFQMSHALALFFTGLLLANTSERNQRAVHFAGMAFTAGILLFCGTLYWLAIFGSGSLGIFHVLTPVGGMALLAGWLALIVANFRTLFPGDKT